MAKKKGGFGRKQIQKLSRWVKIRRIASGSKFLPDLYMYGLPDDPAIKADEEMALIKAAPKPTVLIGRYKPGLLTERYKAKTQLGNGTIQVIVSKAVEASSKTVIDDLGVKLLDVSAKPESVHTLGTMIAAKAIVMARDSMPGSVSGGVLSSIGRSSIDLSVSPEGVVTASIGHPSKKGGGKPGAGFRTRVFPAAPNGGPDGIVVTPGEEVSVPKKTTRKKKDIEVGETTVIKDEHGVTHIHIHSLNLYITAELVQQLNVNPQLVQNVLADKLAELRETLQKNALPKKDTEEDEEDEEEKKKKKGKKTKK